MAGELLDSEFVVGLDNIGKGAAVALFNAELRKALDNIADLNTVAKAKRKIVLEVTLLPTDDRQMGQVVIDCKAKLAPRRGESTAVYFAWVDGQRTAVEANPTQGKLFDKKDGTVVPLHKGE